MYGLIRLIVIIFIKLKFNLKMHNKRKITRNLRKGGYIIACNHQKYYDPVAIAAVFKGKFSFMAKSELFENNKIFAWLIRRCGAFPVSRGAGDGVAVDKSLQALKNGRVFVIFPEGTRSKDGSIGRGKSGIALIASQSGMPVIPVCIMYGLAGNKKRLDFAIGNIISPEQTKISQNNRGDIKRVSSLIIDSIKELQEEIYQATSEYSHLK